MAGTFAACLEVNEAGGRLKLQKWLKAEKKLKAETQLDVKKKRQKIYYGL